MVDYYTLTGFHCDEVSDRRLTTEVSATARATRNVRDAVRIARDVATGRNPRRVIPIAVKPADRAARKPYSTI